MIGVELAACPFCGVTDSFIERADFSACYATCNGCGARGPSSCDENDEDAEASESGGCEPGEMPARRLWNRRAVPMEAVAWREKVEIVEEWLAMAKETPKPLHSSLNYVPISPSEIDAIDAILALIPQAEET